MKSAHMRLGWTFVHWLMYPTFSFSLVNSFFYYSYPQGGPRRPVNLNKLTQIVQSLSQYRRVCDDENVYDFQYSSHMWLLSTRNVLVLLRNCILNFILS